MRIGISGHHYSSKVLSQNIRLVTNPVDSAPRHQMEALHFIIQREGVITDDVFSLWEAQHNDDGNH